ncbi:MAG: tetratricopeptide repeat protein [Lachnospiraceae bacterium]
MKFVDRTEERKFMRKIANEIMNEKEICVWIEGVRGSGKSYFMKNIKDNLQELPLFNYNAHEWLFKCNESGIEKEYQLFTEIISNFQVEHPKKFNDFLVKYFEKIYDISWIETLAYIVPSIKFTEWAKGIISTPLEQIELAKKDISNRLYTPGLKTCLAELVFYILSTVQKRKSVVFCIDDACWLDEYSIDTLKMLLNLAKYKSDTLKISLIVLTRPADELNLKKENYSLLENVLNDIYENNIKYIRIKNFDYKTTKEYVEIMEKNYTREITHSIFQVTSGNPQQLFQTLKFNDNDLKDIMLIDTSNVNNNFMSAEHIIKLAKDNTYVFPVLCSISLLQQKMRLTWLTVIVKNFCNQILKEEFNSVKYDDCINTLQVQNIIESNNDIISVIHDSLKETAIEYIKNSGEYIEYMDCLTNTIYHDFDLCDAFLKELIYLYSEFSPIKCFELFIKYYTGNTYHLDGSIIRLVGQCLSEERALYTVENITNYIVPIIIDRCIQLSYYDLGYTLCTIIYQNQEGLSNATLYRYYIDFAKILIDKGKLNKQEKYNAIDLIESIFTLPQLSSNQRIESYIISMSAYEHLLDFKSIEKYNTLAKKLIENESVTELYHAMYLRNQGLVKSHCELEQQYIQSLEFANQIENEYERNLMIGTCNNNLGLHYLYTSNVGKALQHFGFAKNYLNEIGYDIFRVLNNIAICYLLMGDNEKAYDFLLQAKVLNTDCVFEKLCIQSNIAIIEYKQKKYDSAKNILTQIIDDSKKTSKQTADDLVYSSAMVNMAYFYYLEEDYVQSSKLYKDSMFFSYRYNDDLQKKKRKEMLSLSMYNLGLGDKPLHNIDIEDTKTNIFNKMYAPIAFAYYII